MAEILAGTTQVALRNVKATATENYIELDPNCEHLIRSLGKTSGGTAAPEDIVLAVGLASHANVITGGVANDLTQASNKCVLQAGTSEPLPRGITWLHFIGGAADLMFRINRSDTDSGGRH